MTLKYTFQTVLIAGAIMFLATVLLLKPFSKVEGSSFPTAPAMSVATTSTSISVTTSTRVLASTTNPLAAPGVGSFTRAYAVICNAGTNPVYLNLDGDKLAGIGEVTTIIAAAAGYNACFELTDARMIYNGSIQASSTNETATVISVKDYVY